MGQRVLIVVALAFLVGMAVRTTLNDDVQKEEMLMDAEEHSVMDKAATEMTEDGPKKTRKVIEPSTQCAEDISQPSTGNDIQSHFDSKRKELGIHTDVAADRAKTCTKRDVCLLMRQLDMDFYKRARAGQLTDAELTISPEVVWFSEKTCRNHDRGEGKRYAPVMDEETCKAHVEKLKVKGAFTSSTIVKEPSSKEKPAGCSIVIMNKRKATVFLNTDSNSTAQAGTSHKQQTKDGKVMVTDKNTMVLCEHDRTLSESAATFYSPYKMKKSMAISEMEKMSTACSFGMVAHLARTKQTESSCANILTFRTDAQYYSAEDALKKGNEEYVKKVKAKNVLMSVIANDWCPSVWKEALASPQACLVPRVMDEAAEDAETLKKLGKHPRMDKIAFVDDFCEEGLKDLSWDEPLSRLLNKTGLQPPDFFGGAGVA